MGRLHQSVMVSLSNHGDVAPRELVRRELGGSMR